ncbi:alpha/beta hydrolase fold domain-containing protein [Xinfangfangia sp. CPCC 101601]|uniref:Alpha/beta hydrolase fold domain-containing protein n=1 Tax=Pseudogemmobacter lacusdianii TaxID=3069608 RepID=A0ABU0W1D1_9RHOB|nr:alpha/beta hydrolase fold domain-containing protein [Xinfangfangia sp. CPCC 101601]MDQ2067822.1 alpha/beta hydrolase fold domain-containing protein [Xinfangfangia sp. CPCC 101601]
MEIQESAAVDWVNGDPVELRRIRASSAEVVSPVLPPDIDIQTLEPLAPCPGGLIFTPPNPHGTPVVYFHGGGFIVGSPETHRINTAWIAHLTGAEVISVRYRLAPEHTLPAQPEDGVAAIRRQLQRHEKLRVMGDSAGGALSLWAHAGLTEAERARIEELVLFYAGGLPDAPPPTTTDESTGLGPLSMAAYRRKLDPTGMIAATPSLNMRHPDFPRPQKLTVVAAGADPVCNQSELLATLLGGRLVMAEGLGHSFLADLPAPHAMHPLRQALGLEG